MRQIVQQWQSDHNAESLQEAINRVRRTTGASFKDILTAHLNYSFAGVFEYRAGRLYDRLGSNRCWLPDVTPDGTFIMIEEVD